MKDRVINIDFSQFWVHPLFQFLPNHFLAISLREWVSQFAYTCCLDKLRQFEHWLQNTSFSLQEFRLLIPMSGNWHCILKSLHLAQKKWIRSCNIPSFNQVRSFYHRLQLCNLKPSHHFLLFPRLLRLLIFLVLLGLLIRRLFLILLNLREILFGSSQMLFENVLKVVIILAC